MIYFLHGTDIDKAKKKAGELIGNLLKRKPDASFFKMNGENWDPAVFEEYINSQGLFENKYIVFVDRICEDKEKKELLLDKIKQASESSNIFIILEGKLDKASLSKIEKNSEKAQEFEIEEKSIKEEKTNSFAIADCFGKKDSKNAWVLFRKAMDKGEAPEAIHGMLFWKVKTMILNSSFSLYSKSDLHEIASMLLDIYHQSRRGMGEIETGVERLLLSIHR